MGRDPSRNRVVVTGLGAVTPLGVGVEEFWSATLAGKSGVASIEHFDASKMPVRFAGYCKSFDASKWLEHKQAKHTDRFTHLAVAAADLALADAGIDPKKGTDPERFGAVVASGIGGLDEILEQTEKLFTRGPDRV